MSQQHPINIRQIDHVVLRVQNLSRMIDFYCDALGCTLERGPGDIGLAQLRAGGSLIDLVDVAGPLGKQGGGPPAPDAPNMDHVCLQVQPWDVDAITAHLEKHDVEVGDVVTVYGSRGNGPSLYVKDPEGNSIELKGVPTENPASVVMQQITRINHVGLRVRDLDRSRAFYEKLGFEFIVGPIGPEPVAVMEHPSGININFILNADCDAAEGNLLMDVPEKHAGFTHIALEGSDREAVRRQLGELGIPITETVELPDGAVFFFVRDPDENVIEFHQPPVSNH